MPTLFETAQQLIADDPGVHEALPSRRLPSAELKTSRMAGKAGQTGLVVGFRLIVIGAVVAIFAPPVGAGLAAGGAVGVANNTPPGTALAKAPKERSRAVEDLEEILPRSRRSGIRSSFDGANRIVQLRSFPSACLRGKVKRITFSRADFAPRIGYASPPEQEGGWSAARRSIWCAPCERRAVPGTPGTRLTALHRGTRQVPEDSAQPRAALPGTRALRPCPSPASSSQSGPSAARAGPRSRPSAWLRATPAGTTPRSVSQASLEDAPDERGIWINFLVCGKSWASKCNEGALRDLSKSN